MVIGPSSFWPKAFKRPTTQADSLCGAQAEILSESVLQMSSAFQRRGIGSWSVQGDFQVGSSLVGTFRGGRHKPHRTPLPVYEHY